MAGAGQRMGTSPAATQRSNSASSRASSCSGRTSSSPAPSNCIAGPDHNRTAPYSAPSAALLAVPVAVAVAALRSVTEM